MFYKIRRDLNVYNHNRRIRKVMETRPIRIVDAPWTICSMVGNGDVLMYIVGMKSFYRRLKKGKLKVIVARTMARSMRDLLRYHFTGVEVAELDELDTGTCQRGGTWERIVHLIDLSRDQYAIQVDADTLSCGGNLDEILACIEQNRAFVYRDAWPFPPILTLRETAAEARKLGSNHVAIAAERQFVQLPDCDRLKYIRGSSGFAGFAKGGFDRARLEEFHGRMEKLLGDRWREWGSEQVASNYCVSNSPGVVVLPHPQYRTFSPTDSPEWLSKAKFLHFIGSTRYEKGYFVARSVEMIREFDV
jgi:hypothetical protein